MTHSLNEYFNMQILEKKIIYLFTHWWSFEFFLHLAFLNSVIVFICGQIIFLVWIFNSSGLVP